MKNNDVTTARAALVEEGEGATAALGGFALTIAMVGSGLGAAERSLLGEQTGRVGRKHHITRKGQEAAQDFFVWVIDYLLRKHVYFKLDNIAQFPANFRGSRAAGRTPRAVFVQAVEFDSTILFALHHFASHSGLELHIARSSVDLSSQHSKPVSSLDVPWRRFAEMATGWKTYNEQGIDLHKLFFSATHRNVAAVCAKFFRRCYF